MFVYSKRIYSFIKEIKNAIKHILNHEIRLKVTGDRFLDRSQSSSYPIKVVVFNNKSLLGYFDSDFYELGFHEALINMTKEQLHQVIRHELAHYMTFISYGAFIQHHGPEFRAFCDRMGWGEEIYRASSCLEGASEEIQSEEGGVLRKVQKLMALSTSGNKHEAEQAMIKSQQLLLKHNIDAKKIGSLEDDKVVLKRILKQKRENAKMRAIAIILETFFVSTVYCRAGDHIYLEILGDSVNVEIADYVAAVLEKEFDKLWDQAKRQSGLKGTVAKNSFFLGIAKGYCNKIRALKTDYHRDMKNGLMVIEKKLVDARAMVYSRLSSTKSFRSHCSRSSSIGEKMGRQLNINPAINRSSTSSGALIEMQH